MSTATEVTNQHNDIAAQARSLAESHDSIAEVLLAGSPTFVSRNRGNLDKNTAELLRQCAQALEAAPALDVQEEEWKDHQTAQLVNDLRDTAVQFQGALMNPSSEREAVDLHSDFERALIAHGITVWGPRAEDFEAGYRAALSTQPQQAGWMPIETAPEDTNVLVATTGGHVDCAFWTDDDGDGRKWWWLISANEHAKHPIHADLVPTHWMPLPPVPGQEGGGV